MRPRGAAGRAGAGGFTLLEITLAMGVLGMIAAMCYGAFHLGVRAVEKGEVAVVTAQRLRVASDVLIRQIKSTVAYPARNEDEEVYPYFVGSATSMTFVTAAGLQGGGGLTRVVYQVVDDPPRLVMSESHSFSPDALGREPVEEAGDAGAVLLDGFRSLKFEYLLNDGVETDWRRAWDGREDEMLPAAVRIVVEGLPGLELDTWGQEIPLMVTAYGGFTGEADEEEFFLDDDDDDTGVPAQPPAGGPHNRPRRPDDPEDPDE